MAAAHEARGCAAHRFVEIGLKVIFSLSLVAITGISGLYLYGTANYASATEVENIKKDIYELRKEIRQDLKEGFDRIEKRLP